MGLVRNSDFSARPPVGPVLVKSLEKLNTWTWFGDGVMAQHPQHILLMEHEELRPGLWTHKAWLKPSLL